MKSFIVFAVFLFASGVVSGSEISTDGVAALLEAFDVNNNSGIDVTEMDLYLQSIRGLEEEHCLNASAIFQAAGIADGDEADSPALIQTVVVMANPCLQASFCGTEMEVELGDAHYECVVEEDHDHDRILSGDDHEEEHIELEALFGSKDVHFECEPEEEEEEEIPDSYSAEIWGTTLGAVFLVAGVSWLCSVLLFVLLRKGFVTLVYIQDLTSLAAGIMLFAALVHVLPEAVEFYGGYDWKLGLCFVTGISAGMLVDTFLPHGTLDLPKDSEGKIDFEIPTKSKPLTGTAINILVSDAVGCNFSDGLLIALAFGACGDNSLGWVVAVSVMAHEIPAELAEYMMLIKQGQTPLRALLLNMASSLTAFFGAILILSLGFIESEPQGLLLAFAAGVLLFLALGELVPSAFAHAGKRYALRLFLLAIGLTIGGLLELAPHEHCEIGHAGHDH